MVEIKYKVYSERIGDNNEGWRTKVDYDLPLHIKRDPNKAAHAENIADNLRRQACVEHGKIFNEDNQLNELETEVTINI